MESIEKLRRLKEEIVAEEEMKALKAFEISLGKTPKEAAEYAAKTTEARHPRLKGHRLFKIA